MSLLRLQSTRGESLGSVEGTPPRPGDKVMLINDTVWEVTEVVHIQKERKFRGTFKTLVFLKEVE